MCQIHIVAQPGPSGAINESIPLFNLSYKGMKVPISLTYSQSGVRIDELSGWTGHGWELNTGFIDQTELGEIVGKPSNWECSEIQKKFSSLAFYGGSSDVFNLSDQQGHIEWKNYDGSPWPKDPDNPYMSDLGYVMYYGTDGMYYRFGYKELQKNNKFEGKPVRHYLSSISNPKLENIKINYNYINEDLTPWVKYITQYKLRAVKGFNGTEGTGIYRIPAGIYSKSPILSNISCDEWTLEFETTPDNTSLKGVRLTHIRLRDKNGSLLKTFQLNYTEYQCPIIGDYFQYSSTYGCTVSGEFYDPFFEGSNVDNNRRAFLTGIEEYNEQETTPIRTWSFDYYSPGSLPQRLSFKQNAWGFYTDYESLGSKFFDLVDFTSMPEIGYNPNKDVYANEVGAVEDNFINQIPCEYFKGAETSEYKNLIEQDRRKGSTQVVAGMLKSITYPMGNSTEFKYASRPYGNLLSKVIDRNNDGTEVKSVRYTYEDGTIPLAGKNYIAIKENVGWDWTNYYNSPIKKIIHYSNGAYFNYEQPLFKKVTTYLYGGEKVVDVYTTAADPIDADPQGLGFDNLPAEVFRYIPMDSIIYTDDPLIPILQPFGNGEPTSRRSERGKKLESIVLNNSNDTISKTQWFYSYPGMPVNTDYVFFKSFVHANDYDISDSLQHKSYYRKYFKSNPYVKIVNTDYEKNPETLNFEPIKIRYTESEGSSTSTHKAGPVYMGSGVGFEKMKESEVYYAYPVDSYEFKNENRACIFEEDNGITTELINDYWENKVKMNPSYLELHKENGKIVGGTKKLYQYKRQKFLKSFPGLLPKKEGESIFFNLAGSSNGYSNSDEFIIVMSKTNYDKYEYNQCALSTHFVPFSDFGCQIKSNGNIISSYYGDRKLYSTPEYKVVFVTTYQKLESHGYFLYSKYPDLVNTIFNQYFPFQYFDYPGTYDEIIFPEHYTGYFADCIISANASLDWFLFPYNQNGTIHIPTNKNIVFLEQNVQLELEKFSHKEIDYASSEYYYDGDIYDHSVKKILEIDPEYCERLGITGLENIHLINDDSLQVAVSYDKYDEGFNNPLQITDKAGLTTSYIYYPGTSKLKYKVVNATYDQIKPWDSSATENPRTDDIRAALSEAFVSEFKYDVLGRIIEQIDVNGRSQRYIYNNDGLLHKVLDNDNNIIKQVESNIH